MSTSKRRSVACERCHAKKIRCFGGSPCQNCHAGNHQCTYPARENQMLVPESYIRGLQYEAFNRVTPGITNRNAHPPQVLDQSPTASVPRPGSIRHRNDTFSDNTDTQPPLLENTTAEGFVSGLKKLGSQSISTPIRHAEVAYDQDATSSDLISKAVPANYVVLNADKITERPSIKLPPFPYAKQLIQQFESFVGYEYSWYHRKTFHERFVATYREPRSAQGRDRLWLCQLFAVLALGASYSSYEAPSIDVVSDSDEDQIEETCHPSNRGEEIELPGAALFEQTLSLFKFPVEEIRLGHVEVLNLITFYCYSLNRRSTAYMYAGMALRAATSLDLGNPSSTRSSSEPEHRRRVWWTVLILDVSTAIALGIRPGHRMSERELDEVLQQKGTDGVFDSTRPLDLIYQHLRLCTILEQIHRKASALRSEDYADFHAAVATPLNDLRSWKANLPGRLSFDSSLGIPPEMHALPEIRPLCSLYLRYQQGFISLIRPVFFKIIAIIVGKDSDDTLLNGLVALATECAVAARHNLEILRALSATERLAKYGFWESLHLSSGIMIALLSRQLSALRPENPIQGYPDEELVSSSKVLLSHMAGAGNMAARNHVRMLEEVDRLLEFVAENAAYSGVQDDGFRTDLDTEIFSWIQWAAVDNEYFITDPQ